MKEFLKNLKGIASKNSPTILTAISVAGLFTTVILASKATIKAEHLILDEIDKRTEELKNAGSDELVDNFTKLDIIRISWKCYVPTIGVGLATVLCIIGSNSINLRRNAALASAYTIAEKAFTEYQSKVVETIGRNKEQTKIRDEIAADTVRKITSGSKEVFITGKGEHLIMDSLSGRFFKSDIENVRQVINNLNAEINRNGWASLNDLYYELGLNGTTLGDLLGWSIGEQIDLNLFSSQVTANGEPCLVLNFKTTPKYL